MKAQVTVLLPLVPMLLVLTGCPQRTEIWVPPGATVRTLVFEFGKKRGVVERVALGSLVVTACKSGARPDRPVIAWFIRAHDEPLMTDHVRYGDAPSGFDVRNGAAELTTGCYDVRITGTGETRLRVDANGRITDLGPNG